MKLGKLYDIKDALDSIIGLDNEFPEIHKKAIIALKYITNAITKKENNIKEKS